MTQLGRKINRPNNGHHQKPLVQSFVDLKLALKNECVKTQMFITCGDAIITNTLFVMKNPIKPYRNTSKTILRNGQNINFIQSEIHQIKMIKGIYGVIVAMEDYLKYTTSAKAKTQPDSIGIIWINAPP